MIQLYLHQVSISTWFNSFAFFGNQLQGTRAIIIEIQFAVSKILEIHTKSEHVPNMEKNHHH